MPRLILTLALNFVLLAAPVAAAERSVAIVNFDRIRVDGPFDVTVTTRATPGATIFGDARTLDGVSIGVDGGTLVVRASNTGWGERGQARGLTAPAIRIQTRDLRAAAVIGSGALTVSGPVAGDRIDLTVTGAGTLAAPQVRADQLVATLIGTGRMTLGGTARSVRLLGNGSGQIAAGPLVANDAIVRTDGSVAVTVTARYTATANSTGLGAIDILGRPECKVKAQAGGPIRCGTVPPK